MKNYGKMEVQSNSQKFNFEIPLINKKQSQNFLDPHIDLIATVIYRTSAKF